MYQPETQTVDSVLEELKVDASTGLTSKEVLERQSEYGLNIVSSIRTRSSWGIIIAQFRNTIVLLLVVAMGVSLLFEDIVEALAILAVILLNALIGFILETQANRSMNALKSLEQPEVKVIRGGILVHVLMEELVPGDLLFFEAGDLVGADARLIRVNSLEVNESSLTGESVPVEKHNKRLETSVGLGDQANMVFRGTSVTRGNGLAVVVFTGKDTEIGHIALMMGKAQAEEIPLNRKLNRFSKTLIGLTVLIMVPFVVMGLIQSTDFYSMIETAIALAVAAIPEGLPIVATIALASGMLKLSKRKVLVRKLAAVETLGGTNVILTDKTGTLTENQLEVEEAVIASRDKLMEVMALCNNATVSNGANEVGDPVEVALLHWVEKTQNGDLRSLQNQWSKLDEIPFESDTRMMATIHARENLYQISVKGATADVLSECRYYQAEDQIMALDNEQAEYWQEQTVRLSKRGLKVLAGAYKIIDKPTLEVKKDLVLVGLVGLLDPARPDVAQAIQECKNAGIRVIMVTGDHPETAKSIAQKIRMTDVDAYTIHGQDLRFSDNEDVDLMNASIYSRVTPEQKLKLVEYYQSQGHVVAMTGDGVNDAPALKKADIGVAMGLRGTEVAKEASDMILQDDSFSSIVAAIKQGRIIFNNIRNFVIYLLSCNLSEILVVSSAAFLNWGSPLLPLQILFLNLVTDVFPALALGMGQGGKKTILQQPRVLGEPILTKGHWKSIIVYAFIITACVLGSFFYSWEVENSNATQANNVAFFTLAFAQLIHPFNLIGRDENPVKNGIVRNPHLWVAIAFSTLLLLVAGTINPLDRLLGLEPISRELWVLIGIGSLLPLAIIHLLKRLGLLN